MGKTITRKQVVELRKEFDAEPSNKVAQNAVTNVQLPDLTLNRDLVQDIDDSFSIKLDDWKVTAQMRTGRCWLFAPLHLFRVAAMKKMKLKNFEFSQAHIHFWDKFERSNHLLEAIIEPSDIEQISVPNPSLAIHLLAHVAPHPDGHAVLEQLQGNRLHLLARHVQVDHRWPAGDVL